MSDRTAAGISLLTVPILFNATFTLLAQLLRLSRRPAPADARCPGDSRLASFEHRQVSD